MSGPVEDLLAEAIRRVEEEWEFDLEAWLVPHAEHADAVRLGLEKLRRSGMVRECADRPPDRVAGRYEPLREIGRGGMGRVLLARDDRLDRHVALKLASASVPGSRARLEREARLLARVEHPNVVPVYDGGLTRDGDAYCAMRVVGGRTLQELLGEPDGRGGSLGELGLARRVQIVIDVCRAIAAAHGRGILHRDLKPANVMVGEHGEVQVLDWGLAKSLREPGLEARDGRPAEATGLPDAVTRDGEVFGTPSCCAPEQARGDVAAIDERTDVFGLGSILHHLLAGRPLYSGADRESVVERARAGRPDDPELARARPSVPAELVAICRKACAPAKEDRYAGARELADDLQAFLEARTVRAYGAGPLHRAWKWVRRNRTAVASAAAVIVAAGAILEIARSRRIETLARDAELVPRLVASVDEIGPWHSERVPELEAWLADAEDAASRLANPREFTEPGAGLLDVMRSRLEQARTLELRSIAGEDAARRWTEAIGDVRDSPRYGGLRLAPQMGLLPVGRDPDSGLWEFAALLTGEAPNRDAAGRLSIDAATSVVLVLVPGGAFDMGATVDPSGVSHDPRAAENEFPVARVELEPYFLSKFEMTQAQWERLARTNPSHYPAGGSYDGRTIALTHPVERVSWQDCERVLRLAGLALPTEAQWERAARAGTTAPHWTGADDASIEGAANVADRACARILESGTFAEFDDGWGLHAPVDAHRANPFGFHGMIGNVCEWCRDAYASYEVEPAPGDGDRSAQPWADARNKAWRDCHFFNSERFTRVTHRGQAMWDLRDATLGVRPARALDR